MNEKVMKCNVCGHPHVVMRSGTPDILCTLRFGSCGINLLRFVQHPKTQPDLLSAITCSGCRVVLDRCSSDVLQFSPISPTIVHNTTLSGDRFALTNCGLKFIFGVCEELAFIFTSGTSEDKIKAQHFVEASEKISVLLTTFVKGFIQWNDNFDFLITCGFGKRIKEQDMQAVTEDTLKKQYEQSPLDNVRWIVFEYTNRCSMSCHHCYNSSRGDKNTFIEENPSILRETADTLLGIGIDHFWFIGGEVTQFGNGWLNVAKSIASHRNQPRVGFGRPLNAMVEIVTSGWFLDKTEPFIAAGKKYINPMEFLEDLKANGISHVSFSLDGPTAEIHDSNRERKLFDLVMNKGFEMVRKAKMQARVSILVRQQWKKDPMFLQFLAKLAVNIYDDWIGKADIPLETAITRLFCDPANLLIPFIDIGTGATHNCEPERRQFTLEKIAQDGIARCKSFFRAGPWITFKSNGVFSLCRVLSGDDEGFGNVHNSKASELLNSLQDRFLFQAHANGNIRDFIQFVDKKIFGNSFEHQCAARAVITMVAQRIHDRNIQKDDKEAILNINKEVALLTGFTKTVDIIDW